MIRPVVHTPTGRIKSLQGVSVASSTGSTPTLGVEEEFLLVDPSTGAPVALNRAVAERAARGGVELRRHGLLRSRRVGSVLAQC